MKRCQTCNKVTGDEQAFCADDSTPLVEDAVATRLQEALGAKYTLNKLIGKGAMGAVYRAHHRDLDDVAIKVMLGPADNERLSERFLREAKALRKLRHQHAVNIYDLDRSIPGISYMVMEMVEGNSLREILARRKQLTLAEAMEVAEAVCDALQAAHERGIIHRDLKPDNILVAEEMGVSGTMLRTIKIADFGIVKLRGTERGGEASMQLTKYGTPIGTPFYMSPEQWFGEGVGLMALDGRTDIYALGCTLYELLAGRVPFMGRNTTQLRHMHLEDQPVPLSQIVPDVPEPMSRVIMRALEKDRDYRPQTAAAFAAELRRAYEASRHETDTLHDEVAISSVPSLEGNYEGNYAPAGPPARVDQYGENNYRESPSVMGMSDPVAATEAALDTEEVPQANAQFENAQPAQPEELLLTEILPDMRRPAPETVLQNPRGLPDTNPSARLTNPDRMHEPEPPPPAVDQPLPTDEPLMMEEAGVPEQIPIMEQLQVKEQLQEPGQPPLAILPAVDQSQMQTTGQTHMQSTWEGRTVLYNQSKPALATTPPASASASAAVRRGVPTWVPLVVLGVLIIGACAAASYGIYTIYHSYTNTSATETTPPTPPVNNDPPQASAAQANGTLVVNAPRGSTIFIDDEKAGTANNRGELTVPAPVGLRNVRVRAQGFRPWFTDVKVVAGQTATVNADPKRPLTPQGGSTEERLQHANDFYQAKNYEAAAAEYFDLIKDRPEDPRPHAAFAATLFQEKRFTEAIAEYEKAARLDEENVETLLSLAEVYRIKGRDRDAVTQLRKAIKISPDNDAAHHALAWVLQRDPSKLDEAQREVERAIKAQSVPAYLNTKALILLARSSLAEALQTAQSAIESDKTNDPSLRATLAVILYRSNRVDEAVTNYKQLRQPDPTDEWGDLKRLSMMRGYSPSVLDTLSALVARTN